MKEVVFTHLDTMPPFLKTRMLTVTPLSCEETILSSENMAFNKWQVIQSFFPENLFHILTYLNIFEHIWTYLNIFQHISTYFNIFQYFSTYFSIFQHISTYFNYNEALLSFIEKSLLDILLYNIDVYLHFGSQNATVILNFIPIKS